jgi:hypothetical protein
MTIEAMKQALDAMETAFETMKEDWHSIDNEFGPSEGGLEAAIDGRLTGYSYFQKTINAITALRTAIEQADEQEAWKTSDTAYRPDGLPQDFTKHEVENEGDWSEWVCPDPTQYFMKCCDCGLVHEMQFNVVKYSAGDKCEDVDDPHVQAVFRARRTTPPAAQRHPLTDEQRRNIVRANKMRHDSDEIDPYGVIDDVEAAHGIKENT